MEIEALKAAFDYEIASIENQLEGAFRETFNDSFEDWDWALQGLAARVIHGGMGKSLSDMERGDTYDAWVASFELDGLADRVYCKFHLLVCAALGRMMLHKARGFCEAGDLVSALGALSAAATMSGGATSSANEWTVLVLKDFADRNGSLNKYEIPLIKSDFFGSFYKNAGDVKEIY